MLTSISTKDLKNFTKKNKRLKAKMPGVQLSKKINFFKVQKDEEKLIRVADAMDFIGQHWGVAELKTQTGRVRVPVICPTTLNEEASCPICDHVETMLEEAAEDQDEKKKELAQQMAVKLSHPMLIIDIDEDPDEILLYMAPQTVATPIYKYAARYPDKISLNGSEFTICNSANRYSVQVIEQTCDVVSNCKNIPNLKDYFASKVLTTEQLEEVLETGELPDLETDSTYEDKPSSKKQKNADKYRSKTPKTKKHEEEELEEEVDEEIEEEIEDLDDVDDIEEDFEDDVDLEDVEEEVDEEIEEEKPKKLSTKEKLAAKMKKRKS